MKSKEQEAKDSELFVFITEGELEGFIKALVIYNLSKLNLAGREALQETLAEALKQQKQKEAEADEVEEVTVRKHGKSVPVKLDSGKTPQKINQINSLLKRGIQDLFKEVKLSKRR
jgi:hypothetical protein